MKEQKFSITIKKPIKDIFAFTIDPKNTPKWINTIISEQTNEWPPKLGTIYKNQNIAGDWRQLKITTFEQDKMFILSDNNGMHIRYSFTSLDANRTELEYTLWIDKGELKILMTINLLKKLKKIIEKNL